MNIIKVFLSISLLMSVTLAQAKTVAVQNEAQFQQIIAQNPFVVVAFLNENCPVCKAIAKPLSIIEQTQFSDSNGKPQEIVFAHVNVHKCESLCNKFKVNATPTFIFFKNKEQKEKMAGITGNHNNKAYSLEEKFKSIMKEKIKNNFGLTSK